MLEGFHETSLANDSVLEALLGGMRPASLSCLCSRCEERVANRATPKVNCVR